MGLKLHLLINDSGELLAVSLTLGNTDDRKPVSNLVAAAWLWAASIRR